MSLPQHLLYGVGGTVEIGLQTRPSTAKLTIYTGDGTALITSQTATISSINTTLTTALSVGNKSMQVASNTGFVAGGTCYITDDPEDVLIRKIDGATIYLRRPVVYDHVNAANIHGTRVSYAVNSSQADTLFWDGRCEWNIDGSIYDYTAVECTKYPNHRLTTAQHVYDEDPKFYQILDSEADVERLLDLAHQDVLGLIAEKAPDLRSRVFTGSTEFSRATVFAFLRNWYRKQSSDEAMRLYDRYQTGLEGELSRICSTTPRDANQDGVVEANERMSFRSVSLRRG